MVTKFSNQSHTHNLHRWPLQHAIASYSTAFRWDANDNITRLLHKGDFCDQWNQHIATNMSRDGKLDVDAVLKKSGNKDKGKADYYF